MELQGLRSTLSYVQGVKDINKTRIEDMRTYLKESGSKETNEYVLVEIAKASAIVRSMDSILTQVSNEIDDILEYERVLLDLKRDTNENFLKSLGGTR